MINAQNPVPARESKTCLILRAVSFLFCAALYLLGAAVCAVAADPPDLSQLSDEQKEQGFGQLQKPDPEPPPSPPSNRDKDKRKHHYHPNYIVGAGAGATGGVIVGNSLRKQRFGNAADYDINAPVDYNSDLPQVPLQEPPDPSDYYVEDPPPAKLMNFDAVPAGPNIKVDVQSLFARDLSRFDAQIVDGINTNQLGWSGATGIEVALRIQRSTPSELGLQAGFALIGGDDEARSSSAQLLYTKPNIGFAPSPFVSYRDTSLATVEGNLLSPVFPWGQAGLGMRWLHLQDTLENQVLPNGLFQHIETKSNSFVIQFTLEPSLEFKRVRLESLFQIGVGPVFSKSNTQFQNLVGGPPGLPNEIVLDRVSGTAFFKGQLGLAIPLRHWLVARTGVQLLAQSDTAPAAAQISHTDLALQRFHLRTESMAIGALFVGIELKR